MIGTAFKVAEHLAGGHRRDDENIEAYKTRLKNRRRTIGAATTLLAVGLFSGLHNGPADKREVTAEGGKATVTYIDRHLSKIYVLGFETRVDGASATSVEENRPLGMNLDLVRSLKLSNYMVKSALCMDAGDRKIEEITEPDGRVHYRIEINPEQDMAVCSEKDLSVVPTEVPGGSWNAQVGDGLTNVGGPDSDAAKKEIAIKAEMRQAAEIAAIDTVNKRCAPVVFDQEKDAVATLIADGLRRNSSEVIDVVYTANANGKVVLSGKSDLDGIVAGQAVNGVTINDRNGGTAGECTVSANAAGK